MIPLHVGTSYTHDFGFYSKGNASATHQIAWAGSLKNRVAWAGRGTSPFEPPFPPYSLFRPKGGQKTIIFLSHFHGLVSDTNYKHLKYFIMLGTLSEPRRGQMSHICDISALRVSCILYKSLLIGVCSMVVLSLASQTPPLFEIGRRGGSLVNRVDFSVPAKEFGRRCWYEN